MKWFHVYRIRLILSHDDHVGRHLHVPNASGKYNAVSCRQAMDLVFSLLYRQASFVLIDKHTYVTLLYRFDPSSHLGLGLTLTLGLGLGLTLTLGLGLTLCHSSVQV